MNKHKQHTAKAYKAKCHKIALFNTKSRKSQSDNSDYNDSDCQVYIVAAPTVQPTLIAKQYIDV